MKRIIFLLIVFTISSSLFAFDVRYNLFATMTETKRNGEYPYHYKFDYGYGGGVTFHQDLFFDFAVEVDAQVMYKKMTYSFVCPIAGVVTAKDSWSFYYVHAPFKIWYKLYEYINIAAGGFVSYGFSKVHIKGVSTITGAVTQDDKITFLTNGLKQFDYGLVGAARVFISKEPKIYIEAELHYGLNNIMARGNDTIGMKTILLGVGFVF